MRTTTSIQLITLFVAFCGATRIKRGLVEVFDNEYGYGGAAPANGIPIPNLEYGVVDLISEPIPVDAAPASVQPEVIAFEPHPVPLETESVIPNEPFIIPSDAPAPAIIGAEYPAPPPERPPVTISRTVKVAVPVPVQVPVPIPRNVPVPIPQPYPYEITKHVPFEVPRPYPVQVVKEVPVKVSQPYPVPVPVPVQNNSPSNNGVYIEVESGSDNDNNSFGYGNDLRKH